MNTFQCWKKKNTSDGKQMYNLKLDLKTEKKIHMNLKRFQHTFKLFTRCYFSLSAQHLQMLQVGLQRFDCKHGGRGPCLTLQFVRIQLFTWAFSFTHSSSLSAWEVCWSLSSPCQHTWWWCHAGWGQAEAEGNSLLIQNRKWVYNH